jgi:hypothetical protein
MDDKDLHQSINSMIKNEIRNHAQRQEVSQIGRIVAVNPGKYYDIMTADRKKVHADIPSGVPNIDWQIDDWVTFEWTGTDYLISGTSPTSAGSGT